jgi:hypothetical protein
MTAFLVILFLLVVLNVYATHGLRANPDETETRKRILIAGIWVVPFFGAFATRHYWGRHQNSPPGAAHDNAQTAPEGPAAPRQLLRADGVPFGVVDHLMAVAGVPILDWSKLEEWVRGAASDNEAEQARDSGRRAWLLHFRDVLGPGVWLHESEHAYILSTLGMRTADVMARYIAATRRRVSKALPGVAVFPPGHRSILLALDSQAHYYHYVAIYYPEEGDFAGSGGMFIHAGCPHFVVVKDDLSRIEPVIAHEMTHSAVNHLKLPKWLDEGLAVNTEQRITGVRPSLYTPLELHQKHLQFWSSERIQEFWTGQSFDRPGDGNLLSYDLARVMVYQMASQWDRFREFVHAVRTEDAGAGAAQSVFGVNLGEHAKHVLGIDDHSDWAPQTAVRLRGRVDA